MNAFKEVGRANQAPTVLVVEDEPHTREFLAASLESDENIRRVDRAASFEEGLAHLTADAPDVLLIDLGLPDGDGVDLIRFARAHSPGTQSMVITVFGDEASVVGALEAGARGYLLKSESADDLRRSVAQLIEGGAPISPAIASHLLRRFAPPAGSAASQSPDSGLTGREREALELIVHGNSYQEVADAMGISLNTATSHIRSIYRRLEVQSRSQAVYEALSRGLVKVDPRNRRS